MGGALPPALLAVALGLCLTRVLGRARWFALILLGLGTAAGAMAPTAAAWSEHALLGLFAAVAACAGLACLPRPPAPGLALVLAGVCGVLMGLAVTLTGRPVHLATALFAPMTILLAAPLSAWRGGIALKVLASWVGAIAVLAAGVSMVPTPGYVRDHME